MNRRGYREPREPLRNIYHIRSENHCLVGLGSPDVLTINSSCTSSILSSVIGMFGFTFGYSTRICVARGSRDNVWKNNYCYRTLDTLASLKPLGLCDCRAMELKKSGTLDIRILMSGPETSRRYSYIYGCYKDGKCNRRMILR